MSARRQSGLVTRRYGPHSSTYSFELDNIETELNLAITTRYAELTACSPGTPHASCGQHDR